MLLPISLLAALATSAGYPPQIMQQAVVNSYASVVALATPGLVNEFSLNSTLTAGIPGLGVNPTGQTFCATSYSLCAPFADAFTNQGGTALAGNLGIVAGHFANSTTLTPTVSDDKSDSFTCTTGASKDSGTNEWPFICYFPNLTSGAHMTTTTTGTTHVTQVTAKVSQFYNIALTSPLDGTIGSCAGSSSSTANCASVTPTVANDLIYVLVCRAGTPAVTSFTAGSGFTLVTEDINDGCASEVQVDTGTGSITPTMTMASASTYIEIVAAFKASATSAGTPPAGMNLNSMMSFSPASGTGTSVNYQFTSKGDFLFASAACGAKTPSGVTDSVNGAWTSAGTAVQGGSIVGNFYKANAAANATGLIALTTDATSGDCGVKFYDFSGVAAAPVVAKASYNNFPSVGASGLVWQNIDTAHSLSWLPASTSGIVFAVGSQFDNTTKAFSAPTTTASCLFDAASFAGMPLDGPEPIDQNNTWGHCYVAAGTQPWFAFTESSATEAVGDWSGNLVGVFSSGIGIKNAVSGAATSTPLTLTVPATTAGNLGVAACEVYNSAAARTITKVCFDGTTCAAGNAFTVVPVSSSTGSTSRGATSVWALTSLPASATTLTVTASAAANDLNCEFFEVAKPAGGSWAIDNSGSAGNGAQTTGGTGSSGTCDSSHPTNCVDTGPSITITGSGPDFCAAAVTLNGSGVLAGSGALNVGAGAPASGNDYTYGNVIWSNDSNAAIALLTTTSGAHAPKWQSGTASDTFNASNACFK